MCLSSKTESKDWTNNNRKLSQISGLHSQYFASTITGRKPQMHSAVPLLFSLLIWDIFFSAELLSFYLFDFSTQSSALKVFFTLTGRGEGDILVTSFALNNISYNFMVCYAKQGPVPSKNTTPVRKYGLNSIQQGRRCLPVVNSIFIVDFGLFFKKKIHFVTE